LSHSTLKPEGKEGHHDALVERSGRGAIALFFLYSSVENTFMPVGLFFPMNYL
jgi:hypothetical protein